MPPGYIRQNRSGKSLRAGLKMKITYINNAGVLVDWGGGRMMIDVIAFFKSRFSDPLPEQIWEGMLDGEGELRHVDYLAATHVHPDHVSAQGVAQYAAKNAVKALFLPAATAGDVRESLGGDGPEISALTEDSGTRELSGGAVLSWFRVAHIGNNYRFVGNYCFEIAHGGKRVLIIGDAEPDRDVFEACCTGRYDVVIINPMFFNDPNGRHILIDDLGAQTVIIYHMPAPEDINMVLRRLTEKQVEKSRGIFGRLVVFSEPFESITV